MTALVVATGASAETSVAGWQQIGPPERTIWALVVDDVPQRDVEVVLRPGGPWIDPAVLERAGLRHLPEGLRESLFGPGSPAWVSLPSLAPQVQFRLDEEQIRLVLTVDPSLFEATNLAISNPRPPQVSVRGSPSAFVNYSAQWSPLGGTSMYAEVAARLGEQLLTTSALVDSRGHASPGLTSWNLDQVSRRRRWVIGDTVGRATTLGSTPVVGGFSVTTEPSLDPYYVAYPSPTIEGAVRTPSTADVYVDGRLVSELKLPPGRFSLSDLPVTSGLGRARVVLRDAFGREQELSLGFYLATSLLGAGEQNYTYVAGWERQASESAVDYGRPVVTLLHRIGVTDALTLQFQAEGARGVGAAGGGVAVRLWRLGEGGLDVMVSRTSAGTGLASTINYNFLAGALSADLRGTWIGPHFANLYLTAADRGELFIDSSSSLSLGWLGTLSLGYTLGSGQNFHARVATAHPVTAAAGAATSVGIEPLDRTVRGWWSASLGSRLHATLSTTRSRIAGGAPIWEGLASLNVVLGRRTVASAVASVDREGRSATLLDLQHALPPGPGYGFRVDADTAAPYASAATLNVQHRYGAVGVRAAASRGERADVAVNVAGGLVAIGGGLFMTRPVDDAFALVRVPNQRSVRVFANHHEIGRTTGNGTAFVPDLQSYIASTIGIAHEDLPVDVRIGAIQQAIAPPYRGGAVVTFDAVPIRALVGRIDFRGTAPKFGTLVVTTPGGLIFSSPLNERGDFYLEDVPPGEYTAVVTWNGQTCRVVVRMPVGAAPLTDLGVVACQTGAQR